MATSRRRGSTESCPRRRSRGCRSTCARCTPSRSPATTRFRVRRSPAAADSYQGSVASGLVRHARSVGVLVDQIESVPGLTQRRTVALVGVGDLGHALAGYAGFISRRFRFAALLDADPARVGERINGLAVHHIDEIDLIVRDHGIQIAVIATPVRAAQAVADRLVAAGVTSILNFAPCVLGVPERGQHPQGRPSTADPSPSRAARVPDRRHRQPPPWPAPNGRHRTGWFRDEPAGRGRLAPHRPGGVPRAAHRLARADAAPAAAPRCSSPYVAEAVVLSTETGSKSTRP